MVSQVCLDKIAAMPPPLNHACPSICDQARFIEGTHCSTLGMPMDSPFITMDPAINPPNGGYCYCCCSCFSRDTPIEKSPGGWVMVQDIEAGDTILAAGADLVWQPTKVKSRSGSTSSAAITGLYLIFYKMDGEENPRQVLVTPGHLFLTAESRVLKPVQFLAPGDRLAQADGKAATVVLGVRSGQPVPTSIHTLCMDGSYDGSDLTGRLVNTNGLVSADFEVQVRYEAEHAESADALLEIGSPEYIDRHHSDETVDQLAAQLPREFAFETGDGMVRVPNAAKRFVTDEESDHLAKVATFSKLGNAGPRVAAQRVIALARTVFSDVFFLIDWRETTPNVYAFVDGGQKVVIMNGGFLRIKEVYSELALMAAITMAARLNGKECVCEADYYAYAYGLRELVTDTTFVDIVTRALSQNSALFALIGTAGRGGSDPCYDPTMECRQRTIGNALAFQDVPPCGMPLRNLELVRASLSGDATQIDVIFSAPVEKSSASAAKNYSLLPQARIQSATVDSDNPARVVLRIDAMAPSARVLLIVEHVVSRDNLPLAAGGGDIVVQPA